MFFRFTFLIRITLLCREDLQTLHYRHHYKKGWHRRWMTCYIGKKRGRNFSRSHSMILRFLGHTMGWHIFSKSIPISMALTLGEIASICFRFHFQQTLRMHPQECQECQKIRNFVRNSEILIARSTIQPKWSKIKNNLPFFKEFWWIS